MLEAYRTSCIFLSPGFIAGRDAGYHNPRMGLMSARLHVCVALLLASTSVAGCLFGGGGDKKRAARAAPPTTPPADSSDSAVAIQSLAVAERSPATDVDDSAGARAQQAVGASRIADAAVAVSYTHLTLPTKRIV